MKKLYTAPMFTPVKLDINGQSGACAEKGIANMAFEQCSVELEIYGASMNVFGGPYDVSDCFFNADELTGICYYTAYPGFNVFNS